MGVTACVLGYSDPDVNKSITKGLNAGSMTTLNAIEEVSGFKTEIVFYRPNKKYELLDYLKENAHSVISRRTKQFDI